MKFFLRTQRQATLYLFIIMGCWSKAEQIYGGCGLSKKSCLLEILKERFCENNSYLLCKQHPHLNELVTREIFEQLRTYEREKQLTLTTEDALSLFSIYATVRVGFAP